MIPPATQKLAAEAMKNPALRAALAPAVVDSKSLGAATPWLEKATWTFMSMARALKVPDADARVLTAAFIQKHPEMESIFNGGGSPNMIPFMQFVGANSTFER
jgi:hypothetical protein